MPKLSVTVPHQLAEEEAVRRLKSESDVVRAAFGDRVSELEEAWEGNTLTFGFRAMGMRVRGQVAVSPSDVQTTAEVPLAAMMFKGAIQQQIETRLGRLLAS
ncbi:MAG: polyhydroxyalkanoic acid system family protein [Pirellulales bacterium]|nr:polyhydroxyalkanoic acid system family protein [Pirellulales bacterium]